VKGMRNSKTFIALAILIAMSAGIYLLNMSQEQALTKAEDERTTKIITEISTAINQRNIDNDQKFQ